MQNKNTTIQIEHDQLIDLEKDQILTGLEKDYIEQMRQKNTFLYFPLKERVLYELKCQWFLFSNKFEDAVEVDETEEVIQKYAKNFKIGKNTIQVDGFIKENTEDYTQGLIDYQGLLEMFEQCKREQMDLEEYPKDIPMIAKKLRYILRAIFWRHEMIYLSNIPQLTQMKPSIDRDYLMIEQVDIHATKFQCIQNILEQLIAYDLSYIMETNHTLELLKTQQKWLRKHYDIEGNKQRTKEFKIWIVARILNERGPQIRQNAIEISQYL